jgi:hypothetical protein
MKFGDDWRGIFIRGDNAFGYWMLLKDFIEDLPPTQEIFEVLRISQLEELRDLFFQALETQLPNAPPITPDSECQHIKAFLEAREPLP